MAEEKCKNQQDSNETSWANHKCGTVKRFGRGRSETQGRGLCRHPQVKLGHFSNITSYKMHK